MSGHRFVDGSVIQRRMRGLNARYEREARREQARRDQIAASTDEQIAAFRRRTAGLTIWAPVVPVVDVELVPDPDAPSGPVVDVTIAPANRKPEVSR
jgi:hypothetical protein